MSPSGCESKGIVQKSERGIANKGIERMGPAADLGGGSARVLLGCQHGVRWSGYLIWSTVAMSTEPVFAFARYSVAKPHLCTVDVVHLCSVVLPVLVYLLACTGHGRGPRKERVRPVSPLHVLLPPLPAATESMETERKMLRVGREGRGLWAVGGCCHPAYFLGSAQPVCRGIFPDSVLSLSFPAIMPNECFP